MRESPLHHPNLSESVGSGLDITLFSKCSALLAPHLRNDLTRGFDTITFSYSLSMIPQWEKALNSPSLMSDEGRVLVADFDTYTKEGKSIKDSSIIRTWYKQRWCPN
jgi:predicted component of viral defense system (DUF524 family)